MRWIAVGGLAAALVAGLVYTTRAESPSGSPGQPAEPESRGADVSHESYSVSVLVPASVAAGKEGVVTVAIAVKPGWKLNQEFPTKLIVTPPSGVTLKKDTLRVADATAFTEKKGSFPVVFTAATAGDKAFSAKLRFAVCTDTTCDPKTEDLRWTVTVH